MEYSEAQRRDLDCQFLKDVLGYTGGIIRTKSHLNPGKEAKIRVFSKEGLIDHFVDPSGEFQRCYRNSKDDTDGLASPVPRFSSDFRLTAKTVARLGFVVWPLLPERDGGRSGVMFLQHQHGLIDDDAFHLVDVKGVMFEDVAVGACVASIMWVNGDLPDTSDNCVEAGDEDDEEQEV